MNLAPDAYDLELKMIRLYKEYDKWGVGVSTKKSEYLEVNSGARFQDMMTDNSTIPQIVRYKS